MYVAQKSSFAASSVTFSVTGCFTRAPNSIPAAVGASSSSTAAASVSRLDDLVVVCDNVLTLYEVWGNSASNAALTPDQLAKNGSLRYVSSVTLATSPTGVSKVSVGAVGGAAAGGALAAAAGSSAAASYGYADQIVLTFDHEHLSVIGYDSLTCAFVTNALYRLGEQTIMKEDVGVPSLLAVDPLNRCIAMLLRRRYLAIIPIYKTVAAESTAAGSSSAATGTDGGAAKKAVDNWGDDEDEEDDTAAALAMLDGPSTAATATQNTASAATPTEPIYKYFGEAKYIDLLSFPTDRIRNTRDMAFVPSPTGEPTLGFLCERESTWAGRAKLIDVNAGRRTANLVTCCVAWLVIQSSSIFSKSASPAVGMLSSTGAAASPTDDQLAAGGVSSLETHQVLTSLVPFNATRLVPCVLPNCDAGFLVLAANSILHVTRTRASGFYLNEYGREEATCSNNTKIHWSQLERPQRKVERIAEHNLTFSDAVAAMVGPRRAIVACPVSGLISAIDVIIDGRDVVGMTCMPIMSAAIASTLSLLGHSAAGVNSTVTSPALFANFFVGSAVGDSLVFTANVGSGSNNSQQRLFPWMKSVLQNYGPIVATDTGDFTTAEVIVRPDNADEGKQKDETTKKNGADSEQKKEGEGEAAEGTAANAEEEELAPIPNPYADLLSTKVQYDAPTAFVPLSDALNTTDMVAIGGEGVYGHMTIARQSIRPQTILSQAADCVGVFVADPNAARHAAAEASSSNGGSSSSSSNNNKRSREEDDDGMVIGDDDEDADRLKGGADAAKAEKTNASSSQILFLSHLNGTNVYELSNRVVRLGGIEDHHQQPAEESAAAAASSSSSCVWKTNARTVWAGAASCTTASSATVTRLVQVTDRSVVIVEESEEGSGADGNTSRHELVAEVELIKSHDTHAANDDGSASNTLKHAFIIANTTFLCATSTAGITYVVDIVNPSVRILNDLLAAAAASSSNTAAPIKVSAVCDGAEAGFGAGRNVIFVADATTGALSIVSLHKDDDNVADENAVMVTPIATIANFSQLPTTVLNGVAPESNLDVKKPRATTSRNNAAGGNAIVEVTEMVCSAMGGGGGDASASSSPSAFFYALSACGEVAVYKIRPSDVSLFKVDQKFVDREFSEEKLESLEEKKRKLNVSEGETTVQDTTAKTRAVTQRLVKFTDLLGGSAGGTASNSGASGNSGNALSGVFVCGRRSSAFLSRGGKLVHHHLQATGPLRGFCALKAKAIAKAKFIIAGEGYISYCALDKKFNYLSDWCTRREMLRSTPHCVGYVGQHRSCFVVTSEQVPFRPARAPFDLEFKIGTDEEGKPITTGVVPRTVQPFIPITDPRPVPMTDKYTVNLFNAFPLRKCDEYHLEENEQVLSSCVGTLHPEMDGLPVTDSKGVPQAMTVFVVGTAFPLGEDITSRGRLVLLKPSVPSAEENDNGEENAEDDFVEGASPTKKKPINKRIVVVHSEDCKGPVTALTFVKSYIAATIGGTIKIYTYDSKYDRLSTVSFLGAGNFIPKMLAFKEFIVFGDLFNSVTLAKLHGGDRTAYVLGKHAKPFEVSAVDIVYKGKEMGIVVGGPSGQSLLLSYQGQRDRDGNVIGGKLVEECGIRLSAGVSTTLRLRVPKPGKEELSDEALIVYTTAGGELGFFHPISERISRILTAVSRTMSVAMPQTAGLDPLIFKAISTEDHSKGTFTPNLFIDGDSVEGFLLLSLPERAALAMSAKVSQDRVLNALCGLSEQSFLML